ncbi:MAG: riboflavin synthase [Planctomycetota bacterium]
MFTGLIEAVCTVKTIHQTAAAVQIIIDLEHLADQIKPGDSIAVNGVCLTVAALQSHLATFDISSETLAKSTLGKLRPASPVNIERALKLSDRLGGHFVLGHIDGTATLKTIHKHGQFADIEFATSPELLDQMVVKGSVAVDGISLTIANMSENSFTAAIIPETLQKTTLGRAKSGDHVNIETDIIAKIIRKHLQKILPDGQKLTIEKLRALGF